MYFCKYFGIRVYVFRVITSLFIVWACLVPVALKAQSFVGLKWVKDVGAKSFPAARGVMYVNDFGAIGDAMQINTEQIQNTIDQCAKSGGGKVSFRPGVYLTGSLFVKSNVNFEIPKGVTLIGSQSLSDYKRIDTRVAGIEMNWPSALINVIGQKNAAITGDGVVNGRGKIFWDKYWSMRKEYEPKGLRWIVDYDCDRPQGIIISDSEDVTVNGIVIYQPGFWSLHILYSQRITVDGVIISNNIEGRGPSTDGVDIDSSSKILIQNSDINCNDDNFCLKSGRDADGLRVNRPCEYVVIRNCRAGHGEGLFTCGSETSGGIRNVLAYNLVGDGTRYGMRFKSTIQRGGVIENIYLENIKMTGVVDPFIVDLNWNPAYSNSLLPKEYNPDSIPVHWRKMLTPVDPKQGIPKFKNIHFKNIDVNNASTCVKVSGIENSTIEGFYFENVHLQGEKSGYINWAKNWVCTDFVVSSTDRQALAVTNCENVKLK